MSINNILLIFLASVYSLWIAYLFIGKNFALDIPNRRKKHLLSTPQMGGIIFGPLFLLIANNMGLLPYWYIVGATITILLGTLDDLISIGWKYKFVIQLCIGIFISYIFWSKIELIYFYELPFNLSQINLLLIFLIWFIGIYNAVNLIDGLDGLAGGFMLILSFALTQSDYIYFNNLNLIFGMIILGFLIFNQRPAKLFMGDAGSLFLGFHVAVLPLLYINNYTDLSKLDMTPFILCCFYLIADTTRVFLTRIANKKSPMTADTIHFHHLIMQKSGSYLTSIGTILFITTMSVVASILSFNDRLPIDFMFIHIGLLLLFILTPPIETYIPIISDRIVSPFYQWHKSNSRNSIPYIPRTIFAICIWSFLLISLFLNIDFSLVSNLKTTIILFLILFYVFYNRKKNLSGMYVLNISIITYFIYLYPVIDLTIQMKIAAVLLLVSYIIFTIERRKGSLLSNFSTTDILIVLFLFAVIILSLIGVFSYYWFSVITFSLWFGLSFIYRRVIYLS